MKKFLACMLLAAVALTAHAGEPAHDKVHVDIDAVVKRGAVEAVNNVTSSGQPNAAAFRVFAESGYVAVVDLRGPKEARGLDEMAVVEELGLDYVPLPIVGRDAISYENAQKLDALIAGYNGPVLVHCKSGNRVGALLALRESLAGADDKAALEYGRSAGLTRHEPLVKKRLAEE